MSGLQGIGGILDDLIITGSNAERHLSNLEGALERMSGMGIKLKNNLVQRVFRLPTKTMLSISSWLLRNFIGEVESFSHYK